LIRELTEAGRKAVLKHAHSRRCRDCCESNNFAKRMECGGSPPLLAVPPSPDHSIKMSKNTNVYTLNIGHLTMVVAKLIVSDYRNLFSRERPQRTT
jgi:hypothetical protein